MCWRSVWVATKKAYLPFANALPFHSRCGWPPPGYSSELKRLEDLEEQRPMVSLPARFGLVLAIHQQELRIRRGMVAEVREHNAQFLWVKGIFKPLLHGSICRFLVWFYVGYGRRASLLFVIYLLTQFITLNVDLSVIIAKI